MFKKIISNVILLSCIFTQVSSYTEIDRSMRIVGGTLARVGQFPHAVALVLHLTQMRSSFCGGSIIHPNYVLTAAHCLDDIVKVEVMAGVHSIFRGSPQYQQVVEARDIRKHPQYNTNTLINDIGLLFLRRRIPFNNVMQTISLPPQNHVNNRFLGVSATIVGWGRFSDASENLSDTLRFVSLPIVRDQHCIDVYNQDYRFFNPSNICVSGTRGSSCGGDSGSAQHVTLNGETTIIGLVSYGSATCEGGHPPVMTRITSYLDWISANTGIQLLRT